MGHFSPKCARAALLPWKVYNAAMSASSRASAWEMVLALLESLEIARLQSDLPGPQMRSNAEHGDQSNWFTHRGSIFYGFLCAQKTIFCMKNRLKLG